MFAINSNITIKSLQGVVVEIRSLDVVPTTKLLQRVPTWKVADVKQPDLAAVWMALEQLWEKISKGAILFPSIHKVCGHYFESYFIHLQK